MASEAGEHGNSSSSNTAALADRYRREGFLSGIPILSPAEAQHHRGQMEAAEARIGKLHYKPKVHTILRSPYEIAVHPRVLDLVETLIGPDILLYNVTYIVKEPGSASHVSWHQDLTYWGLSDDAQVSMWLAQSPADAESGCMRMVPGSHLRGQQKHEVTPDANNVLLQGQTVAGVAENSAVLCPLKPGEASLHHGWTLHASMANRGADRRIGLNVQYLAPHVRQTQHDADSALLVRGSDPYGHYATDVPAQTDLAPEALARQAALERLYFGTAGNASSTVDFTRSDSVE